jgi:hypothetical protein
LLDVHRELLKGLDRLEALADPAATAAPTELAEHLAALEKTLGEHFRDEEDDGFAQSVLARAPQFDRRVRGLMNQHTGLAQQLCDLTRTACQARIVDELLRLQVRAWIERLRKHENQENRLLEDAFNVECCAED